MVLTMVVVTTMTVMTTAGVAAMVMAKTATGTVMTAAVVWGAKIQQSTSNPTHRHHCHRPL